MKKRCCIQWLLLPLVFIVIGLGWKYPILGFIVPIVMFVGIIGAFFNGRYVCGNLCPRGAFYDRLLSPISFRKHIPRFLKIMSFRWVIFVVLMGFMFFRILQNPMSWQHWGHVFWFLCVITTGFGLILGMFIHQRTWCAFCPVGTLVNVIGGGKNRLRIETGKCISCHQCERVCPLDLCIVQDKSKGILQDRDCLRCSECIDICPKKSLCLPQ